MDKRKLFMELLGRALAETLGKSKKPKEDETPELCTPRTRFVESLVVSHGQSIGRLTAEMTMTADESIKRWLSPDVNSLMARHYRAAAVEDRPKMLQTSMLASSLANSAGILKMAADILADCCKSVSQGLVEGQASDVEAVLPADARTNKEWWPVLPMMTEAFRVIGERFPLAPKLTVAVNGEEEAAPTEGGNSCRKPCPDCGQVHD